MGAIIFYVISVNATSLDCSLYHQGLFYKYVLTLIPAWISNYILYNVWDEITYPFLNFNGATVEV